MVADDQHILAVVAATSSFIGDLARAAPPELDNALGIEVLRLKALVADLEDRAVGRSLLHPLMIPPAPDVVLVNDVRSLVAAMQSLLNGLPGTHAEVCSLLMELNCRLERLRLATRLPMFVVPSTATMLSGQPSIDHLPTKVTTGSLGSLHKCGSAASSAGLITGGVVASALAAGAATVGGAALIVGAPIVLPAMAAYAVCRFLFGNDDGGASSEHTNLAGDPTTPGPRPKPRRKRKGGA